MTEAEKKAYTHFALFGYKGIQAFSENVRAKALNIRATKYFNEIMGLIHELSLWLGSLEVFYKDGFSDFDPRDFWNEFELLCSKYRDHPLADFKLVFDDYLEWYEDPVNKQSKPTVLPRLL